MADLFALGLLEKMAEWGVTNPFKFPPNEFNLGVLQAVEPFLRVHAGPRDLREQVPNDKFQGGKMDIKVLETCVNLIGMGLSDFERTYKEPKGELGFRPRHLEMIRQVEKFTTPTDLLPLRDEEEFLALEGEQKGFFFVSSACEADQAGQADMSDYGDQAGSPDSVTAGGHSPSNSGDDQSGYHMDSEAAPQGPMDVEENGRTDCRGFVFNEGPRSRAASEDERTRLSPQRCAFLGEFKRDENICAIYQGVGCARAEVRRNLANRHYKTMYILGFSRAKFTYAVLKVQGYIVTGGLAISPQAYEDFKGTTEPGSIPYTKDVLDRMWKTGTTFYRQNFRSKSNALYPKRPFIVGDLYVAPSWYMLPTNEIYHGMISPEAVKFYEGLLRIVIGDKVLNYRSSHVEEAVALRMAQNFQQTAKGGVSIGKLAMLMHRLQSRALGILGQPNIREVTPENAQKRRPLPMNDEEQDKRPRIGKKACR